jgi:hypothetical protein
MIREDRRTVRDDGDIISSGHADYATGFSDSTDPVHVRLENIWWQVGEQNRKKNNNNKRRVRQ